jgi:CheY-like chemotaxis protein
METIVTRSEWCSPTYTISSPKAIEVTVLDQAVTRTVLVVEDDEMFIYMLHRYLRGSGWQMVNASRGRKALALARDKQPMVIVLDIMLPEMDGWTLLRKLKEDGQTRDIPVVLCSALDEKERGLTEGAVAYLRKPILRQDFLDALDDALATSRP